MNRQSWIAMLLIALATLPAAAEVLDQQNDTNMSGTADTAGPFSQEIGQTFTVGVTGTLTRIETQLNRIFGSGGTVMFTVYNTSGGVPNASLATGTKAWDAVPTNGFDYQSFDVSSFAIPVHAGDVFAFAIKSSGDTTFGLRSTFNVSTYAGGESKFRVLSAPPGPWQSFSSPHDYGFKTYVLPAPVGLPGDFNNNGVVDAADYVTWRDHVGDPTEGALNGNGDNMNGVDPADYALWRSHFATTSGSGAISAASVPEPNLIGMLLAGAIVLLTTRSSLLTTYV